MDVPAIEGVFELWGAESGNCYGTFNLDRYADTVHVPSTSWRELMQECGGEILHAYDVNEPDSDMSYAVQESPWN